MSPCTLSETYLGFIFAALTWGHFEEPSFSTGV